MRWNWQQTDWASFQYDPGQLRALEERFLREGGRWLGAFSHLGSKDQETLRVDLMSQEALQSSRIEGEVLDRESMQASIRRLLGLEIGRGKVRPAEYAIAELTVSVYRTFDQPLDHAQLHEWHLMLTQGRRDLQDIGRYRTHPEPMQIVSGPASRPQVHFEAPPSDQVPVEMDRFVQWFRDSHPEGSRPLSALTRAGIAHLYFESIHPFEDGNGRLGRALVDKVLSQALGQPSLLMLADTIEKRRKAYYEQLGQASLGNQLDGWLQWFGQVVLDAQESTYQHLAFLLAKGKFMQRHQAQLNSRQEKALLRVFREGPKGFKGGLSARNYQRITGASAATTTRDLNKLVGIGALRKTGERKSTRYWLHLPE
jgi:Fic family protein